MQVINLPTNIGFFLKKAWKPKLCKHINFSILSKGKYTYFEIYIN